jgi:hypothetical protein
MKSRELVPSVKFHRMSPWAQVLAAPAVVLYMAWMLVAVMVGFPFLLLVYAVAIVDGRKGFEG